MMNRWTRLCLSGVGVGCMALASAQTNITTVNPNVVSLARQTMVSNHFIGFGYNQYPIDRTTDDQDIPWTTSAWDLTKLRMDYISPGFVRLMWNYWWFDPTGTVGDYDWNTMKAQAMFKVLNYYKRKGITVEMGVWGTAPYPNDYGTTGWARIEADLMHYLLVDKGYTNIKYWNDVNEMSTFVDYPAYLTEITNVKHAFQQEGLPVGMIVGGDDPGFGQNEIYFNYDPSSMARTSVASASITWKYDDISSFDATVYLVNPVSSNDYEVQVSSNGTTWTTISLSSPPPSNGNYWQRVTITPTGPLPLGTNYVRVTMLGQLAPWDGVFANMLLNTANGPVNDRMEDWSKTYNHTNNWKYQDFFTGIAAQQNPSLLGGYEFHWYPASSSDLSMSGSYLKHIVTSIHQESPGKPVLLGESAAIDNPNTSPTMSSPTYALQMASLGVGEARAGIDGVAAWALDGFNLHANAGMWNIDGSHGGTTLRPWFYTWSLLCRYIRPGSTLYAPSEPSGTQIVSASISHSDHANPHSRKNWTFAAMNNNAHVETVTIIGPWRHSINLSEYEYTASIHPANSQGFPVPIASFKTDLKTGFTVTVPANGFALLTSLSH